MEGLADEDWKIKRELLLEKKVKSVDAKEAFRLQKENEFVILDVRPEAEFKEVSQLIINYNFDKKCCLILMCFHFNAGSSSGCF